MQSEQPKTPIDESNFDPDLIEMAPPLIPEPDTTGITTRNETGNAAGNTTPTVGNAARNTTGDTGNTGTPQPHRETDQTGRESLPVTPVNDALQESESSVMQPGSNAAEYLGLHGNQAVYGSNQAGLQPGKNTGNTEEKGSKSYRLPMSVILSMEDAVQELKKVLPDMTAHQYGIDILTKHRELRQAVADANFHRTKIGEQQKTIQALMDELIAERARTADLTAQLSEMTSYLHRTEHTPVGNPVIPPVIPQQREVIQPVIPGPDQEYSNLLGRYESAMSSRKSLELHIQECHQFLNVDVVRAVNALIGEAARNSWFRPAYYSHVFHASLSKK